MLFLYRLLYTNMAKVLTGGDIPKKEIIRVSISEAARLFGVNPQTIRRAIKAGEITYVVVAGRYKINFESLVRWSQEKTTVKKKSETQGIGQYVSKWNIRNTLYSPSKKSVKPKDVSKDTED
jgi:excisionase family DNA binding protein